MAVTLALLLLLALGSTSHVPLTNSHDSVPLIVQVNPLLFKSMPPLQIRQKLESASFNYLLRCGDIISQPGPSTDCSSPASEVKKRKVANPCIVCHRGVTKASKAVSCDSCDKWTHVRCDPSVSLPHYDQCVRDGGEISFVCRVCCLASLPFAGEEELDRVAETSDKGVDPASAPPQVSVEIPSVLLSKGLHFIHSNTRSILSKISEVRLFLSRTKAAVFAASETWLDSTVNDGEIAVPGFNVVRQDRNRNGGGVALFIRDSLAFNPRPDLAVDGLEATWVEILLPKTKGILVCVCYRPPNDGVFLQKFDDSLAKIEPGSEFYILGDLNIDTKQEKSSLLSNYVNLLNMYGCSQLITEATRVTPGSATILDHIITNVSDKIKDSGVINSGFSDHLMTFCSRGKVAGFPSEAIIKKVRSFKNYSVARLNDELKKINWDAVLSSTDVNFCLSEFNRLFKLAVDSVAPVRDVKVKQKTEPWMSAQILSGIKERDRLLSKFKKERSNLALYRDFCRVRNAVQRDIKMAKSNYLRLKLEQSNGDSKKLWKQLKSLGYSSRSLNQSSNIVLDKNGDKIFDSLSVAGIFNSFYTSVASNLVAKLPNPSGIFGTACDAFRNLYRGKLGFGVSFTMSPVSQHFILGQLQSLDPNKAVGLDDISSKFLKDGACSIVKPVSHIVNISIITETVPLCFKQARVVPLFKKGSKLDPGNYRPVSILNVLSKILERAVHGQLKEFLERRDLLYRNQSGFRGKFSTDSCLIGLSDFVKGEMGRGNMVGMVLIDLQKAFDTVDHEILLKKLNAMGVTSVSWFRSYLSERRQCVVVNGRSSDFMEVTCGVPQGSILGPQLFLIYVNDMQISLNCGLALYADDSALIFSHKDGGVIADRLGSELSSCKRWLIDNKLSLHVGKTECLLFGSSKRLGKVKDFQVKCDGELVTKVNSVKYLGVQLDGNMNGKAHAECLIKKCGGRLSFLYRKAKFLNFDCRKILCSALIQPLLDYCCSSWYSCLTQQLRCKLDVIQRRMVRFVFSRKARDHVDTREIGRLGWLTISDRVKYFKLLHVFKIRHGIAPDYLSLNFEPLALVHNHNTRGSQYDYFVSRGNANSPKGFAFTAIRLWNGLPISLKEITSVSVFKSRLKAFLSLHY
jgi:hypothetical protein